MKNEDEAEECNVLFATVFISKTYYFQSSLQLELENGDMN